MCSGAFRKGQDPRGSPIAMLLCFFKHLAYKKDLRLLALAAGWGLQDVPSACCSKESVPASELSSSSGRVVSIASHYAFSSEASAAP